MISIELVILLVMLGVFIGLLVGLKLPAGLSLMAASVIGWVLSWAIQGTPLELRFLVEGGFGYLDCLLVIVCAMVFIKGLQSSGALDYLTAILVKVFKKFPTVLLLIFMAILMLPGMVTGSSTAGVISAGVIVAPIMIKMGMPKPKVAGFIGLGAVLGMVAPPINIPVMVICDVVDIAYNGFEVPLLLLTVPMALFACIFFSRDMKRNVFAKETTKFHKISEEEKCVEEEVKTPVKEVNVLENIILSIVLGLVIIFFLISYFVSLKDVDHPASATLHLVYVIIFAVVAIASAAVIWIFKPHTPEIDLEELGNSINLNITKEIKWTCLLPLAVIVLLFVAQSIWPKVVGVLATPLLFIIAFIPTLFLGKKFNVLKAADEAIDSSIGVMGLLMGVGMFIEIMTLNGTRGYIVINILTLMTISTPLLFVALAVSMTLFGGISSFASASVFGGPFVMALYPTWSFIIVSSACSLVAALGEFLPPTAMSARLAAKNLNDMKGRGEHNLKFGQVTKASAIPLAFTLAWAMVFVIVVAKFY